MRIRLLHKAMRSRAERLLVLLAHLGQKLFRVRALHPLDIRFPPDPWLAAARASVMLPMEEFSCQSSMEHTCVQYCSITVNGEGTNAWGRRNYLWLDVDTLLRWIILITPLGSLAFSHWGAVKA